MELLFWLYLLIFTFSRFDGILMFYCVAQVWLIVRQYQNNPLQTNAGHSHKISRTSTIEQTTGVSLNSPKSQSSSNNNNNNNSNNSDNNNTNNSNKQRAGSVNSSSNRVFFNNVSATGAKNTTPTHPMTSQNNLRIVQILHIMFESIPLCILQSLYLICTCNQSDNTDSLPHQKSLTIMIVSVFSCLIVARSKYVAIDREFFDHSLKSLECVCRNGCCCCHRYSLWVFLYFNIGYLTRVTWRVLNIMSRLCLYILLWSVAGPICVLLFIIITLIIWSILVNLVYFVEIKKNTLYDFLFFHAIGARWGMMDNIDTTKRLGYQFIENVFVVIIIVIIVNVDFNATINFNFLKATLFEDYDNIRNMNKNTYTKYVYSHLLLVHVLNNCYLKYYKKLKIILQLGDGEKKK